MRTFKDIMKRIATVAMSAVLVANSMPLSAFAAEIDKEDVRIAGFAELEESVREQELPVGAEESEIVLPDTLTVTVEVAEKGQSEEENDGGTEDTDGAKEASKGEEAPEGGSSDEENTGEAEGANEGQEYPGSDGKNFSTVIQESFTPNEAPSGESGSEEDGKTEDDTSEDPESVDGEALPESEDTTQGNNGEDTSDLEASVGFLSGMADFFFPALTVYAAEAGKSSEYGAAEDNSQEITLDGIEWTLDADHSSRKHFSSENAGDHFVYEAVLPDGYTTDEDLPTIKVTIIETDEKESTEEAPAFERSQTIDGVKITVTADEGVFPEGAELSVKRAGYADRKQAEEAVEDAREEEQNVAKSYTFDIKVLDQDGNEIEPADEGKVKVSFTLDEVADENLTTNVYHITEKEKGSAGEDTAETQGESELTAEKLTVETDGDTAVAETDGFSLYTVEFTYNNLQYVLPGDSSIALSEILDKVGLTGEVSAVEVSDESLFSADNENGEWVVTAHQAFSTNEWMKVTIGGVEYEITVTDDLWCVILFSISFG